MREHAIRNKVLSVVMALSITTVMFPIMGVAATDDTDATADTTAQHSDVTASTQDTATVIYDKDASTATEDVTGDGTAADNATADTVSGNDTTTGSPAAATAPATTMDEDTTAGTSVASMSTQSIEAQEDTDAAAAKAVDDLFTDRIGTAYNRTYDKRIAVADVESVYDAYMALTDAQKALVKSDTATIVDYHAAVIDCDNQYQGTNYNSLNATETGYALNTRFDEMSFYGRYGMALPYGFDSALAINGVGDDGTITVLYDYAGIASNFYVAPGDRFTYALRAINNTGQDLAFTGFTADLASMTYASSGKSLSQEQMDYFYRECVGYSNSEVDVLTAPKDSNGKYYRDNKGRVLGVDYSAANVDMYSLMDSNSVAHQNLSAYLADVFNGTNGYLADGATSEAANTNLGINFWTTGNEYQAVNFGGYLAMSFAAITHGATYSFVSGTEGAALPDAINTDYLPVDSTKYLNGRTVFAQTPSAVSYATAEGTWTFQGWDADSRSVNHADVAFVGTWTFEATPVTSVTPTTPTTPVTPTTPTTPVTPTTPTTPVTPAVSVTTTDTTPIVETVIESATPTAAAAAEETIVQDATPEGAGHPVCWVHWFIILGMIITVLFAAGVIIKRKNDIDAAKLHRESRDERKPANIPVGQRA